MEESGRDRRVSLLQAPVSLLIPEGLTWDNAAPLNSSTDLMIQEQSPCALHLSNALRLATPGRTNFYAN
jgi:hypothetical protein